MRKLVKITESDIEYLIKKIIREQKFLPGVLGYDEASNEKKKVIASLQKKLKELETDENIGVKKICDEMIKQCRMLYPSSPNA